MSRARRELVEQVGGAPTATQLRLIEQVGSITLALSLDERALLEGRSVSDLYPGLHVALSAALTGLVATAPTIAVDRP